MSDDIERCCYCRKPLEGDDLARTIYVRVKRFERWGSEPCCTPCWERNNPDRVAVRFLREKFEAEEGDET